jgi:hypothetical protein
MISFLRPACLALIAAAMAGPACAQTWVYESDYGVRAYRPAVVYQGYAPRVYDAYAYQPVVAAPPVAIAPTQRTVVDRTIIPQGRGRAPIVRERIVTESTVPAVRPAVVARPAVAVTDAYAYAPAPRVVVRPVTDAYAYVPTRPVIAQPVVTGPVVQSYVNPLAVDPVTGVFLSDQWR